MPDFDNNQFQEERRQGFDQILALVATHLDQLQPKLILDISLMSPGHMQQSAQKEAWQLIYNGIQHLKEGAPQKQPGSMATALTKASLRSSALASTLGIKPPQFEPIFLPAAYTNGHDAAAFLSTWLLTSAETDFAKSRDIIEKKIVSDDMQAAFGFFDGIDPSLKDIFEEVKNGTGIDLPIVTPDKVNADDLGNFRRQMLTSFNMLSASYPACCKTLAAEIESLPPLSPSATKKPKSGKFDL